MLTKSDLQKIGTVVDEKLNIGLDPIKRNVEELRKDVKKQGKNIKYLRKTLDLAIDHFDNRNVKVKKELDRVKEHVGLSAE